MLRNILSAIFLLYCFVLLLMCCAICQSTSVEGVTSPQSSDTLVIFNSEKKFKNGVPAKKYESFTSPSLNYVRNVLVVFAQAKDSGENCDIVEGYFEIGGDKLSDKDKGTPEWKKRVTKNDADKKCAEDPTTVADKNNIYLFFKNSDETGGNIEYQILKSEKLSDLNGNKGIKWGSSEELKTKFQSTTGDQDNYVAVDNGDVGIVVNKTFVVPVWYKKNENKFISIITQSTEKVSEKWNLVLSKHSVEEKHPAIAEWGNKLIMMTSSTKGYRKIYESDNMGTEWKEALWSLSGVWGNLKKRTEENTEDKYGGRNGFIKVDFGNEKEKVLLVTQPVEIEEGAKHNLHLWMTDYQRVYDVGEIATGVNQKTSSTLLYAKENELFVAYETWDTNKAAINIKHLKDQLSKIKEVLQKWKEQDDELSKSCFAHHDLVSQKEPCKNIPINGLVGFLSGNYSGNDWVDKYMCVNATVTKIKDSTVTNVANGLKFSGAGAGATWPVSPQEQNQRYHFVNYAFTLVAAVTIENKINNKENSILGVGLAEDKHAGLLCTTDGNWSVSSQIDEKQVTPSAIPCKSSTKYYVSLILNSNDKKKISAYVDGIQLTNLKNQPIDTEMEKGITHFYFGADTKGTGGTQSVNTDVTITNVLLYNRPFEQGELEKLKGYIKPVEEIKAPPQNVDTNTGSGSSDQQPPTPQPTNSDEEKEVKAPSPSRTEDGGVGGGGVRVFSLLLAVLCVSAPLLHL